MSTVVHTKLTIYSTFTAGVLKLSRSSLAEFKEELLKDEDGSSGAEDDEGLTTEEAED